MRHLILTLMAGMALPATAQTTGAAKPSIFEDEPRPVPPAGTGGTSSRAANDASESRSSGDQNSSRMTVVNGKAMSVTRRRNPDGTETVIVTTQRPGGRPKTEEMTPEAYQKKYGAKTGGTKSPAPSSGLPPKPAEAHVNNTRTKATE